MVELEVNPERVCAVKFDVTVGAVVDEAGHATLKNDSLQVAASSAGAGAGDRLQEEVSKAVCGGEQSFAFLPDITVCQ